MMTPPMSSVPSYRLSTRRVGMFTGLLCCALLAGCASQSPTLSAQIDAQQKQSWQFKSNYGGSRDPIRDILIKQSQQQAQQKAQLANTALEYLGVRYRWGGSDPETGFDCSGLISYAAEQSLGLKMPRQAAEMAKIGQSVKRDDLQIGDLVFFNTLGHRYSHVGIYVGDDSFVHAPRSGAVVRVEKMTVSYWAKRYNGARRLNVAQLSANSSHQ